MYKMITSHNNYILCKFYGANNKFRMETPCNCRNSENCPVEGKIRSTKALYQATIYPKENSLNHIGIPPDFI